MGKNKIKLGFIIILLSFQFNIFCQDYNAVFDAIKTNKVNVLQSNLDAQVDLCILDDQKFMQQSNALLKLKNFFEKNPIVSLEPLHLGNSKNKNASYRLAKITTKGNIYRLFIFFEKVNTKYLVSEIRIEDFNEK
jgi:hypothetical protein